MEDFYIGKYKEDGRDNGGWFLGFYAKGHFRKTNKLEMKYWEMKKGKNPENKALSHDLPEYTVILKGKLNGVIGGKNIELQAGDYIVVGANVPHRYPVDIFEDVEALTFKAPSFPR
jgi:quercetin dioxygenase-like cupin family protein